jgi:ATP-dependent Clp protease ATP-binding subunit ClpC
LGHGFIGTEHLLLGLLSDEDGTPRRILTAHGVRHDDVKERVLDLVGRPALPLPEGGSPPFTPRTKKVLELSLREALDRGGSHIGSSHLLLGIIREAEGVASRVLSDMGVDLAEVRQELLDALASGEPATEPRRSARLRSDPRLRAPLTPSTGLGPPAHRPPPSCSFCGRDLWDVDRCLSARAACICDSCVATAVEALDRSPGNRQIPFPPRLFGAAPSPGALDEVVAAFQQAFGSDQDRGHVIEDSEHLLTYLAAAGRRHPGATAPVLVERIRFPTDDRAEVVFVLGRGTGAWVALSGSAIRQGDRWLVSAETVVQVLRHAGVTIRDESGSEGSAEHSGS